MTDNAPTTIVSTEWLAVNLRRDGVRVLDATWYMHGSGKDARADWTHRRIPGATFFDIDEAIFIFIHDFENRINFNTREVYFAFIASFVKFFLV